MRLRHFTQWILLMIQVHRIISEFVSNKMFKGATISKTKIVFVSTTKIFVLNQIPTYWKLNLSLTCSIYLAVLPRLTSQNSNRPKYTMHFLKFCLKWNNPQTFKSGSNKNPLLQCVFYFHNMSRCFNLSDNWKTLLFIKVFCYSKIFLIAMLLLSLQTVIWKKFIFHVLYPQ